MSEHKINYEKLVSKLLEFVYSESVDDPERVKDLLREYGFEYDEVSNEGVTFVRELERSQRTQLAREKKKNLLEALVEFSKGIGNQTKDQLFDRLRKLSAGDQQLQFAFHKLESLSEEDLRDILNDVDALKMLTTKVDQSKKRDEKPDV